MLFPAELQRRNEHEKNQLTEKFQAAENVLKVNVETTSSVFVSVNTV